MRRTRSVLRLVISILAFCLVTASMTLAAPRAEAAGCTTYYVSSASGSDSNDGCTTATAWKTLTNVNATTFAAGNQILFQDGGSWTGQLHPLGSGASGSPIVISDYGSGAKPAINGGGVDAAVYLVNQQYWTVQNLEVTNTTTTAAARAGVLVENDTSGILSGISILNLNLHDVLGYWDGTMLQPSKDAGISFNLSDSYANNGWDGILIQGNTMNKVDAGGVYIGSYNGYGHSTSTSNVVVQNNTLNDVGGNGIVCVFCDAPTVQYNTVTDTGYRYGGAAMWMALNTGGVWQYNEVGRYGKIAEDGTGFDIDHDNTGVIVQYNYTHDNAGGALEFCCRPSFGATSSIVRYNISQNDGIQTAVYAKLTGLTTTGTTQVYNNTVYQSADNNAPITSGTASGNNIVFSNNLIYKLGTGGYSSSGTWTHNLFYGNHPSSEPTDSAKVTADPLLVAPGGASTGSSTASAYKLLTGSPAISAGVLVSGNGGSDFFGNTVSSTAAPSIGAFNGSGTTLPTAQYGARYTFYQGSGTRAPDVTNHANTGTLQTGAAWTTGRTSPYAVALTGASNSYVDVPNTVLDTSTSYSVSAWVKLNSLTGNQTFASIDGTKISPFYLQLAGGKLAFTVRSSDSTGATATSVTGATAATGTWYHMVGVYDASAHTISLYVNGLLAGSASFSSGWKATGHTAIGRALWNGAAVDFVNGAVDDVQFLPSAISKNRAFALGTDASTYYALDEASGTSVNDSVSGDRQGTLYGNATWTTGKVGASAVSLDGTRNTEVDVNANAVDTGASYTATAWVKFASTSTTQTVLSADGHYVSGFYLQLAGGKLAYTTRSSDSGSSTATSITGPTVTAGTWYQVVASYDASAQTLSLYVNGSLAGTASFTAPWTAPGLTEIGRAMWNQKSVDQLNGQVDDVYFYKRALTTTEISALYSL
ncbi:LamG-like jellyroll fold domain-containing protein [Streptomyces galilaeus]